MSSSWKKRSAKRPVKGEEAGNSDQREQPPTGQTTASVSEGQPSRQQAPRRDSRRRPLGGAAATSMAFGRRWAMDGGAEVGPAPVWRATPRARAETLRAAPETVSGTGQRGGGEWGAGCGDGR